MLNSVFRFGKEVRTVNIVRQLSEAKTKEWVPHMNSWQVHSYGEDLQCTSIRVPFIKQSTEVLVEISAASVNPIDVLMKDGYGRTFLKLFKCGDGPLPITLGRDFSGKIVDKGHGVDSKYKIGDTVYGIIPFYKNGSHAELTVADDSHICHMPSTMNHVEAASLPYASMTAWSALWIFGGLKFQTVKGKRVLILGASGGVGTCAIQLLKAHCATVFGTCSKDAVPLLQRLKIDGAFDYTDPDFAKNVASEKYDIILDCAKHGHNNIPSTWHYSSYITLSSPLLQNTDKYGLLGGLVNCAADIIPTNLASVPQGKFVKWAYFVPCKEGMEFINKLAKNCELLPTVHSIYPFEETMKAYAKVKEGHLRGKVVIDMLKSC